MINGGVKFFEQNFALLKSGANASATSNTEGAKNILNLNNYSQWESVASNDLTTETILINLPSKKTINRIILTGFNFKSFKIKYDNASVITDFTNVIGVNGEIKNTIDENNYAYSSAYFEFDEVFTNQIQITIDTTQVADEQKFLNKFICTYEIGTFQGFPRVMPDSTRNETSAKTLSRKFIVQKTYDTTSIDIIFKTHPYQNDLSIIENIFDREEPFLVYPCGGRTGTKYFKMEHMNWRLQDIYNMQIIGTLRNEWEKGIYLLGVNKTIKLEEHV